MRIPHDNRCEHAFVKGLYNCVITNPVPLIKLNHYSAPVTLICRTIRVLYISVLKSHGEVMPKKMGSDAPEHYYRDRARCVVSYSVTQMSFVHFLASSLLLEVI